MAYLKTLNSRQIALSIGPDLALFRAVPAHARYDLSELGHGRSAGRREVKT